MGRMLLTKKQEIIFWHVEYSTQRVKLLENCLQIYEKMIQTKIE